MSLVSIIVPFYNAEKNIRNCINSIRNQTYKNIEIICVNDGSKDSSLNIMNNIMKEDSRIKLINKINGGVSSARNIGIKNSTGEYIIFVDSDDCLKENMVEILINLIKKENVDLVICNYEKKVNDKIFINNIKINSKKFTRKKFIKNIAKYYNAVLINPPWNKIYKKNLIATYFKENLFLGEDLIFNLDYINKAENIYYTNKVLYMYNVGTDNSLTKIIKNSPEEFINLNKEIYNKMYISNNIRISPKIDYFIIRNYIKTVFNYYQRPNSIKSAKVILNENYDKVKYMKINLKQINILNRIFFSKVFYFGFGILYFCVRIKK